MKTNEEITEFLSKLNTNIDILHYIDVEDIDQNDPYVDIVELLTGFFGFDVDVCEHNAMSYLMEHDNSLQKSIEIANSQLYELEDLNSEILASLLATHENKMAFGYLEEEITEFFNNQNNVFTQKEKNYFFTLELFYSFNHREQIMAKHCFFDPEILKSFETFMEWVKTQLSEEQYEDCYKISTCLYNVGDFPQPEWHKQCNGKIWEEDLQRA